jgi:uncharacterized protein YecT (DUF1311 family)
MTGAKRNSLIGCSLAVLVASSLGSTQEVGMPAPGPAIVLQQTVQPSVYRGVCPVTLNFTALIQKGSWGSVRYHWVRSDGSRTPTESIDFALNEAPKPVSMRWQVDPGQSHDVWATIAINGPPHSIVRASKAIATVVCTGRPSGRASPTTDPCAEIERVGPIGSLVRQCAEQRYHRAHDELTKAVAELSATLEPVTTPDPNADAVRQAEIRRLESLRESQSRWEDYRESACQEVYYETWPGSMADTRRLACLLELTESRIAYLHRRLGGAGDD